LELDGDEESLDDKVANSREPNVLEREEAEGNAVAVKMLKKLGSDNISNNGLEDSSCFKKSSVRSK
jgi:hypothetical protein